MLIWGGGGHDDATLASLVLSSARVFVRSGLRAVL